MKRFTHLLLLALLFSFSAQLQAKSEKSLPKKYTKVLTERRGVYVKPIDFLNETIQKVQVLGFTNAVIQQKQSNTGTQFIRLSEDRKAQNDFMIKS